MGLLHLAVEVFFYSLVVIAFVGAIMSWLPLRSGNAFTRIINTIIAPLREPLDRRIPTVGFLSISLLIVFWGLLFTMNLILYALPSNW